MRREVVQAVASDHKGMWNGIGGESNVTWYVLGSDNATMLTKAGAVNVRKIDDRPLIHDPSVSFWYNKTFLIREAFRDFGNNAEILYIDCDVLATKEIDSKMVSLLRGRITDERKFLAPMRRCTRSKRVPLVTSSRSELRNCPCNCLMYCVDIKVIDEMLPLYKEIAGDNGPGTIVHWTGTLTTGWDDETVAMYWFDKKNGRKTTAEIVEAFEPESVIRLQRHPPAESTAMKKPEDLYLVHH
jgi:hypothetical protein